MKKNYFKFLFLITVLFLGFNHLKSQTCTIPAPAVSGVTYAPCTPSASFSLTASGASTLNTGWYTFPYGGNALNTGSVFTTPTITSSATYYVGQLSAVSNGSIGLPAYASPYSGNTRGMWFTAPANFVITGWRVPTDIGTGNSSIAIVKFPSVPPTYATTTNSFTTLLYVTNVPGVVINPVNIPIYAGDVIGVLGCRSNGTSSVTSYGAAGPQIVSLGTNTLALNRLGMQYVLGTTAPQDLWTEASSVGRIELYTSMGCLSTLTPVTVSVAPSPQILINGPTNGICSGASTTLSASGVNSYTWANNSSNSSSIVVSPSSSTTYTVSGSISPTCATTSTFNVAIINSVPTLSILASSNTVCLGGTVALTGSGANTYTWTGGVTNGVAFSPTSTASYVLSGSNPCGTSTAVAVVSISPLPVTAISTNSIVCSGNTATLTAGGANSYTWLPGSYSGTTFVVSPASTQVYTVIGNVGNCLGVNTLTLATNPVPTIAITPSLLTVCSGVLVNMSASGGNSYTWTPGNTTGANFSFTPNVPTPVSVVGTNSFGCISVANAAVIAYPSPTISISASNNLICLGDQVVLSVSGASTYVWDNSSTNTSITVNPLSTTVYSVTGTTNSCSTTETVSVSVFIPTLSILGSTSICSGETTTLTASNGNLFNWSTGSTNSNIQVNPTSNTIYTLATVNASANINCPANASVLVTVKTNPTLTATASRTTMCKGENNTISVSGANSYTWNTGATSASFVITPSLVTTNLYTVTGVGANACTNTTSIQVKVNSCTGVNELNRVNSNIVIYPNPSNGEIKVQGNTGVELKLINELGQLIQSIYLNENNHNEMSINGLSSGIYFIIGTNEESYINQKIIITH